MNWTQRVLLAPSSVRLRVIVARDTEVAVTLPRNVKVTRARLPGTAGFLLAAGVAMLMGRGRDVQVVMTDRSIVSLLAPILRLVGGYKWVLDIWDAPHKELVTLHSMARGVSGRLRRWASATKVWGLRRVACRADLVLVSIVPAALEGYRIPIDRMRTFSNAIEVPPVDRSLGPRTLGSVCFISRRILEDRRMDLLIAAVRGLCAEGVTVRVTVAGEVPMRTRRMIEESDVGQSLDLLGTVSVERAHEIMESAMVGVIPIEENEDLSYVYPVKLLEYMALGCAVVSADLPGVRAIVGHQKEALLVDPSDGEALKVALRRVLTDERLREGLCQSARKRVEEFDSRLKLDELYAAVVDILRENSDHCL